MNSIESLGLIWSLQQLRGILILAEECFPISVTSILVLYSFFQEGEHDVQGQSLARRVFLQHDLYPLARSKQFFLILSSLTLIGIMEITWSKVMGILFPSIMASVLLALAELICLKRSREEIERFFETNEGREIIERLRAIDEDLFRVEITRYLGEEDAERLLERIRFSIQYYDDHYR